MRLAICGGTVVSESGPMAADVVCAEGRIEALIQPGAGTDVDEMFDASGLLVFPGFIDPHVHSRDPGLTHKETFERSTLAALCGGLTTILEMPNAVPAVTDKDVFAARRDTHAQHAWVDFGLWGIAVGTDNLDALPGLFDAGAVAVKLFWGYAMHKQRGSLVYNFDDEAPEDLMLPPGNGGVYELFRRVARIGGVLAVHCEDTAILQQAAADLSHPIETYADLLAARPAAAEAVSVAVGAQLAAATGCRFHVVHLASAHGVEVVRQAQRSGSPVTAETCPQYLTLTDTDVDRLGPMLKVYPPVRTAADQAKLWAAVEDGTLSFVASDHAPHTEEEKNVGFASAPAGGIGVETIAPVLVDAMATGRLSPARLAEVLSTATARLYGLWPRKGSVHPGTDADLTLVDPTASHEVRNEDLHSLHPVSAWHGTRLRGRIVASVMGATVAMRDGNPVGERRGRFVPANHHA